jgi:putative DNA methylase
MTNPGYRKKLIEVALPLEEINAAAAREKSIRHGHPSTLHLWWARRPLASCRAILFASIVDDPDQEGIPQALLDRIDRLPLATKYKPAVEEALREEAQDAKALERRYKLFTFIERLVVWENSNDKDTLQTAHELIMAASDGNPPPVLDPFAGGGSIPLEAQRLGLESNASDLNPVAVLINKAQIEIPPMFAGQAPVNPGSRGAGKELKTWEGAQGLAEDVRYYGQWMRDEAEKRIGHLFPKAKLPKDYGAGEANVIAWIWARTVKSPNPVAHGAYVPLVRSFTLATKKGKEAWIEPVVDTTKMTYHFEVRTSVTHPLGKPRNGTVGKRGGECLLTNVPMTLDYIRSEAQAGRMGTCLMAVVVEGVRGRIYLSPIPEHEVIAASAEPSWKPSGLLPLHPQYMAAPRYGLTTWDKLFTDRQLLALSTFSSLVWEVQEKVANDIALLSEEERNSYEDADKHYVAAISTYLGLAVSRCADFLCTLALWSPAPKDEIVGHVFKRQALPITWDFGDANPFSGTGADLTGKIKSITNVIDRLPASMASTAKQQNATLHGDVGRKYLIVTDPPYYDNVPYADLSDFFYIWLRHILGDTYPELFATLVTPKADELVADVTRWGGKIGARHFFEHGMRSVFQRMGDTAHADYPITVIYAFKQSESDDADENDGNDPIKTGTSSTGWETFLAALIEEGFQVTGTWPMRTELANRMRGQGSNALASSIALVCRSRLKTAPTITRREFQSLLRSEVSIAIRALQSGNIAPVDLQQSAIGPGMAVFSRYAQVLEANGKPMTVRTALQDINRTLDNVIESGDFDNATNWAISWFSQYAFNDAPYGGAETLATAKAVSISGLVHDGLVRSGGGRVKLLSRDELPTDYVPRKDSRVSVWEVTQYLTRALDQQGVAVAGQVMRAFRESHPEVEIERARDLAYRLFALCDGKKWSQEARPYNALVLSWGDIELESQNQEQSMEIKGGLFGNGLE